MRIGIAIDHGGFGLQEELLDKLRTAGHEVIDFGAHAMDAADDYPDFVVPLAQAVAAGKVERGIAICGSGVGNTSMVTPARRSARVSRRGGPGRSLGSCICLRLRMGR